jgi:hypothetical protein
MPDFFWGELDLCVNLRLILKIMGKKLDRKVRKLRVRARVRRQSLKNNPPAKGLFKTLEEQNRPVLEKLIQALKA